MCIEIAHNTKRVVLVKKKKILQFQVKPITSSIKAIKPLTKIIATIDKSSAHKNRYIKIIKMLHFGGGSWRTGFGIGGFSVQAPDKTQKVFW